MPLHRAFTVAAVLAWCSVLVTEAPRPQASDDVAITLHFSHALDMDGVSIDYRLGGWWTGVPTSRGMWDYQIPATNHLGRPNSLKAAIFKPGYSVFLIDVPSLAELPTREMTVRLTAVPLVRITGRVEPGPSRLDAPTAIRVWYVPTWHCEFYKVAVPQCMVIHSQVGRSEPIGPDGSFSVDVEDFARDPALNGFSSRGQIKFEVIDQWTKTTHWLAPASGLDNAHARSSGIDAARLSTAPLLFYAYPAR